MNKADYAYKHHHQKPKINVLPDDIKFVHADGTLATNAVASVGVDEETGEVILTRTHTLITYRSLRAMKL